MLCSDHLRRIVELASANHPHEACGLIVGRGWFQARLVELDNIQDALHTRDPDRHPRTAKSAYAMDPLALAEAVDRAGGLLCVWHSHCDTNADFSDEDTRVALGGGDGPTWPGTVYLVVSCRQARVDGMRLFAWNETTRRFEGAEVGLPT